MRHSALPGFRLPRFGGGHTRQGHSAGGERFRNIAASGLSGAKVKAARISAVTPVTGSRMRASARSASFWARQAARLASRVACLASRDR